LFEEAYARSFGGKLNVTVSQWRDYVPTRSNNQCYNFHVPRIL